MKLAVILLALAAFVTADISYNNTAYGYLTRFGVPIAEKIRAQEEEYFKNPHSRIFNGQASALGQFPYQAGLLIQLPGNSAVCGAVLVKNNRLITAAHCWFDGRNQGSSLTVVLGSITLFRGGTRIVTRNIAMHPSWAPARVRNDIAVIKLPSGVPLSSNINVVALPSGSLMNELFVGETATASGFGAQGNGGIQNNQYLSHANMRIIANRDCRARFANIQSSNICTQGPASTCRGDSGGPIVVQRNRAPVLVGITSFGLHPDNGGCEIGFPAAYARVTSFMSFINQHI